MCGERVTWGACLEKIFNVHFTRASKNPSRPTPKNHGRGKKRFHIIDGQRQRRKLVGRRAILFRGPSSKTSLGTYSPRPNSKPTKSRGLNSTPSSAGPSTPPTHPPSNPSRPVTPEAGSTWGTYSTPSRKDKCTTSTSFVIPSYSIPTTPIARTTNCSTPTTIHSYPSTSIANDDSHFSNLQPWKSPRPCWNSTVSTCWIGGKWRSNDPTITIQR